MTDPRVHTLVNEAILGDRRALASAMEIYRQPLYSAALRLLGHGDDAKDAVQETFIKGYVEFGRLRDPFRLGAWMHRVLRNHCLMELRRRRKSPTFEQAFIETGFRPELLGDGAGQDQPLSHEDLRLMMGQLSEPVQSAAMLRYFSRYNSYHDIATILGIPVGTVRSRLADAREQLQRHLHADDGYAAQNDTAWSMENFFREVYSKIYYDAESRRQMFAQFHPNVCMVLSSGKQTTGLEYLRKDIEFDLNHDSYFTLDSVASTGQITVIEFTPVSPPDMPGYCPPAGTMVHVHRTVKTEKVYLHYAPKAPVS